MIAWWNSLSTVMQVLWAITLSASLIFVIQTILTFLGLGGDGGVDTDFDAAGNIELGGADGSFDADPSMNLLTFRNFVNFCLGFGWTAVLMHDKIGSDFLVMLLAVVVGIALVAAVMWMFKWLSGMQQSGNIDVHTAAVGCEGKIQITINNAVREYDALCEGDSIPTGTPIKVVGVVNDHTLLVEELNPTII